MLNNIDIANAMTIKLDNELPEMPEFEPGIRRAPNRGFHLSPEQTKTALRNALRYVPEELHEKLAPEFLNELLTRGAFMLIAIAHREGSMPNPLMSIKGTALRVRLSS